MKTYQLFHQPVNKQPAEIRITHTFSFDLLSLEALQQALTAAAQTSSSGVAADDRRLRIKEDDAGDLRWFLETACMMFSLDTQADLIHWRRFLHFLLRQETLPRAETAAKSLSVPANAFNKRGRINFAWTDGEIGLTEALSVRAVKVGEQTADIEFEWCFEGPRILVQNAAIRMLHTMAFDLDSPEHPLQLSYDRGPAFIFDAREAHYRVVNVSRMETTGKKY